jgi:hypothetical protein
MPTLAAVNARSDGTPLEVGFHHVRFREVGREDIQLVRPLYSINQYEGNLLKQEPGIFYRDFGVISGLDFDAKEVVVNAVRPTLLVRRAPSDFVMNKDQWPLEILQVENPVTIIDEAQLPESFTSHGMASWWTSFGSSVIGSIYTPQWNSILPSTITGDDESPLAALL